MREVTVKEFVAAFEGVLAEVEPSGYEGISFEMSKARIEYDEDNHELYFATGNYNHDGIGTVTIDTEDYIDSIEHDDELGEYYISFSHTLSDVTVSRFKSLDELKKERAERKQ